MFFVLYTIFIQGNNPSSLSLSSLPKCRDDGSKIRKHLSAQGSPVRGQPAVGESLRQGDIPQSAAVTDVDLSDRLVAAFEDDGHSLSRQRVEGVGYGQSVRINAGWRRSMPGPSGCPAAASCHLASGYTAARRAADDTCLPGGRVAAPQEAASPR